MIDRVAQRYVVGPRAHGECTNHWDKRHVDLGCDGGYDQCWIISYDRASHRSPQDRQINLSLPEGSDWTLCQGTVRTARQENAASVPDGLVWPRQWSAVQDARDRRQARCSTRLTPGHPAKLASKPRRGRRRHSRCGNRRGCYRNPVWPSMIPIARSHSPACRYRRRLRAR